MERELPEIEIEGTQYLFDIDQMALFEKVRPDYRVLLEDMKDCGTHYEFVYDRNSKRLDESKTTYGIDASDIANEIFTTVRIPRISDMDPLGICRKYNCSPDAIGHMTDFEIMVDQKAFDLRINKGLLPTIEIAGHTFYVDVRMDKLRPKDDFLSQGIVFSDIESYYDGDKRTYTIPYNPKTHEFQEPDYNSIKAYPKDLIAVEFPSERLLDRIGWNRKYGLDISHGLVKQGLKLQFTAKNVPWEKTFLVDLIKSNLKTEKRLKKATEKQLSIQPKQSKQKGRKM
ncbi:hypothetical protein D0817_06675 [Flavobacterium cupreum]|uniref:Uncharacterized protein n=2 Tax=Flavobacterium TaxID=237 RepID=A0A4Y7UG62_9FLAO|nr:MULTISPECIES: hypothetical protein [Flavobacterium]RUT71552.1 hypothetical protein D0817_06675 [Flavobacterium cupreum]TCN59609.1 hypothetical protein EV142_102227 [Flavobacterium circumlabens]TEB44888.1 hypothetical protein D0809_06790 [Flavobacterium circumlabens]